MQCNLSIKDCLKAASSILLPNFKQMNENAPPLTAYTQYETNFPWIESGSFTFYKNGTVFSLGTSGSSFNSGTGILTIDQQQASDIIAITYTRKPKVQIVELQPRPVMGVYPVRYTPFVRLREVTP